MQILVDLESLSVKACLPVDAEMMEETCLAEEFDYVTPSDAEVEALLLMREEEKLARDVYRTLFNRWNLSIFNNISGSEQTHMDTLAGVLASYGITDPVTSDSTGSFNNPALASLYDQLVARGSVSVAEAIQVGIFIEETDITDLQKAISVSTHDDLIRAYENLLQGSYNHLRAFSDQAG